MISCDPEVAEEVDGIIPAPRNLQVEQTTGNSAYLNWTPPSNTSALAGYTLYYSTSPGATSPSSQEVPVGTSAVLTGLSPSTTYYISIVARGKHRGLSLTSLEKPATTLASTVPGNLMVNSLTETTAQLSWASPVDDVAGYTVYYSTSSGAASPTSQQVTGTNVEITGLSPGTTYYFRVASQGASTSTAETSGTTLGAIFSITITGTTATSISLSWGPSPNVTASDHGYQVRYTTTQGQTGNSGSFQEQNICNPNTTTATISGLTAATTYYLRVHPIIGSACAGNLNGPDSIATAEVSVTTTP